LPMTLPDPSMMVGAAGQAVNELLVLPNGTLAF
jgi:hypothetical protein